MAERRIQLIQLIGGPAHGKVLTVSRLCSEYIEVPSIEPRDASFWNKPYSPLDDPVRRVYYRRRRGSKIYYDYVEPEPPKPKPIRVTEHDWSVASPVRGWHLRPGSMRFRFVTRYEGETFYAHPAEDLLCRDRVSKTTFIGHLWNVAPSVFEIKDLLCARCGKDTGRSGKTTIPKKPHKHPEWYCGDKDLDEASRRCIVQAGWALIDANQKETPQ